MKKIKIFFVAFVTVALIVVAVLCVGIFNNRSRNKDEDKDPSSEAGASKDYDGFTAAELIGYGKDEPQAIRLPNSDSLVAIEGITEEDAQMLNQIFRAIEADATVAQEDTPLSKVINRLLDGFDPEFNLVETFQVEYDAERPYDTVGTVAWIANPLREVLLSDEAAEAIYYNKVGEDYTMSFGYYLMAVCYSRAWEIPSTAQAGAEVE